MQISKSPARRDGTAATVTKSSQEVQLHIFCQGQFLFADGEPKAPTYLRPGAFELAQCTRVEDAVRLAQVKLYTLSAATIASINGAAGFRPEAIEIRTEQGQLVVAAQYCYGELLWLWPVASTYEEGYLRFRIAMLEQRIEELEQAPTPSGPIGRFYSVDSLRRQADHMRNRLSEPSYRREVREVLERLAVRGRWIF